LRRWYAVLRAAVLTRVAARKPTVRYLAHTLHAHIAFVLVQLLIAASLAYACAAVLTAWTRWSAAVTPASVAGQLRFRMQATVVALLLHALLARGALNVVVAALVTHAWAAAFAFVARQAARWTSSVGGMLLVGALDVRRYESTGGW
jgi:hypothetical protein